LPIDQKRIVHTNRSTNLLATHMVQGDFL
jgi:hypothetical protein